MNSRRGSQQRLLSGLTAKAMSNYAAHELLKEIWHMDYYSWSGTLNGEVKVSMKGFVKKRFWSSVGFSGNV